MGELSLPSGLELIRNGKGVRVEFQKIGDLYSHTVYLINRHRSEAVLVSQQPDGDRLSPSFIELHEQGGILFLTGASGPCHWSMSVQEGEIRFKDLDELLTKTFEIDKRRFTSFLYFDVACRIKDEVAEIGSQYSWPDQYSSSSVGAENVCGIFDPLDLRFGRLLVSGAALVNGLGFSPKPKCLLAQGLNNTLQLSPKNRAIKSFPATLRWSYGISAA